MNHLWNEFRLNDYPTIARQQPDVGQHARNQLQRRRAPVESRPVEAIPHDTKPARLTPVKIAYKLFKESPHSVLVTHEVPEFTLPGIFMNQTGPMNKPAH